MRPIPFNINFFRVGVAREGSTFGTLLAECDTWDEEAEERTVQHSGNGLRLAHLVHAGGIWRGDLHYIDLDRTAVRGDMRGSYHPVALDEGEGIVDAAAFVYDPTLNVLAIERRPTGPTLNRFATFFQKCEFNCGKVELLPVMEGDAYRRFEGLMSVTKAHLKIAGGLRGQAITGAPMAIRSMIEAAAAAGSPELDVTFSVGRAFRTQHLDARGIKAAFKWLFDRHGQGDLPVTKLAITGKEGDERPTQYLDLIQEKMKAVVNLTPNEDRVIPYATRVAALQATFNDKRAELEGLFRPGQ